MACNDTRREQIAAMAAGQLEAAPAGDLIEHLEACESCSQEFDLVSDLLAARPARTGNTATGNTATGNTATGNVVALRRWLAVAAALIAALLLWQPWATDAADLAELARITPIQAPERLLRGDPGDRGEAFGRGLAAYAAGDFAAVVAALESVTTARPEDALPHLYLGIARLQLDQPERAAADLLVVARHGTGLVQERGLWFRANALLQRHDLAGARGALRSLVELDGDYRANAEQLLSQLAGY